MQNDSTPENFWLPHKLLHVGQQDVLQIWQVEKSFLPGNKLRFLKS